MLIGDFMFVRLDLFMYFCKYIFVGDEMRPVIEQHLKGLPADIASKMKFLVQGTEVLPAKTSSS